MALVGRQFGHYRLIRLVGSGGMGEVYLAEDTRILRNMAIKVVRNEADPYPNEQTTRDAARLFEREMKAITALDHPNILPLIDFGEESSNKTVFSYMVMPFRPEGSLVNWLHQRDSSGILSPQEAVHIVRQAAGALQHAHNRHLMHLDVKPANFLIRQREDTPQLPDVLLTDFGIAKFNSATATASQSIRGTPAYMAPEQWAGSPVAATDQYALAVMAYLLLTGRAPFQGTMQQVMYQHFQQQPQPPNSINAHLPSSIDSVLLRALAKNPAERFPSIQAFADAFEQAWQSEKTPLPVRIDVSPALIPHPAPPSPPMDENPLPPTQYVPPHMPAAPASSPSRPRFLLPGIVIGVIVLVLLVGVAIAFSNHSSNPSPAGPTIPTLKSSYSGTNMETDGTAHNTGTVDWSVTSQDAQGNISVTVIFSQGGDTYSCKGTVDSSRNISLHCIDPNGNLGTFDYSGKISSDGSIQGTEKFDTGVTYQDQLSVPPQMKMLPRVNRLS